MAHDTAPSPHVALENLLTEERGALFAGRLAELDGILQRKAVLIAQVEAEGLKADPDQARRLGLAAERNRALLSAAAEGIQAAMRRIGELKAMHAGQGTYGAGGQRQTVPSHPRVTRRY